MRGWIARIYRWRAFSQAKVSVMIIRVKEAWINTDVAIDASLIRYARVGLRTPPHIIIRGQNRAAGCCKTDAGVSDYVVSDAGV